MNARRGLLAAWGLFLLFNASAALPGNWQVRTSPTNSHLRALTQGQGRLVAVGQGSTIIRSLDGVNWAVSQHSLGPGGFFSVAYGAGLFVVGGGGNALLATSPDASDYSWFFRLNANREEEIYGLTFADGWFVGVGNGSTGSEPLVSNIAVSRDGVAWQFPARVTPNTLRAVAHGNNRFVAVGDLGTIVTSTDALNWSVVNSGTMAGLNAVTYSGARFIAAGDFGTVVISNDGLSWTVAAPTSFAVRGLASSSQAVLAVGSFGSGGRLHASSDGITWPGNSTEFAQALNGAVRLPGGRFIVVGNNGLILDSPGATGGEVNSWTKSTSGDWEEPFWSLGRLPSIDDTAVAFTNAGFKALAIGPSTVANHPDSLRINDLYVDAPTNSHNLLLLNYAGMNAPLTTATTLIGRDGSLLSYHSALLANQLVVNGRATFAELAQSQVGQALIGTTLSSLGPGTNTAELTLSNGLFSAAQIYVAYGVPGIFNQYGGSNRAESLLIGHGIYFLRDGTLTVTNSVSLQPGFAVGPARLSIAGGTAVMNGLGFSGSPGRGGEVVLSGGTLRASSVVGSEGQFAQSGGRAELGDVQFAVGALNSADYTLSGGVLVSSNFTADVEDRGDFDFHQSGGIHTNSGRILLSSPASRRGESAYHFTNGLLFTPHLELPRGLFFQEAGTARVQRISLSDEGFYLQSGGATLARELSITEAASYQVRGGQLRTSNTTVQLAVSLTLARPLIWLNGGEHHIERRLLLDSGGVYILDNGTLAAPLINLEAGGVLRLNGGGNIASNGLFTIRGGILFSAGGEYRFGGLRVPGDGAIDFALNPSTLRFTDAGFTNGALNAQLFITNWTAGSDHLFVGNNPNAITEDQLRLIVFVNPEGFAPGNYGAAVKASGEIVPLAPGQISFTRTNNNMVLTWPEGYTLFSAPEVDGPYEPVPNATSPYTVSFTEPRRFFILRPAQ